MARKKKIPLGNAILCEYATQGSRNKHVLVNVYSGNVVFETLPAEFGFGLFIELVDLHEDSEIKTMRMSLRLDGVEFLEVGLDRPAGGQGAIVFPMVQTRVEKNATFDVVLRADGYADTVAISKRFFQRTT